MNMPEDEWKQKLTPEQYRVLRQKVQRYPVPVSSCITRKQEYMLHVATLYSRVIPSTSQQCPDL